MTEREMMLEDNLACVQADLNTADEDIARLKAEVARLERERDDERVWGKRWKDIAERLAGRLDALRDTK